MGFSVGCYRKTQTNFSASPILDINREGRGGVLQPGSLKSNLISSPSFITLLRSREGLRYILESHCSQAWSIRTVSQFPPPNPSAAPCSLHLLLLLQPHSCLEHIRLSLASEPLSTFFPTLGCSSLYLSPANSYFKPQPRIMSSGGSSPDPINQLPEDPDFPLPSHQVPSLGG